MKEITLGKKVIKIRATPLSLLFYRQEFNADLIGDLMKMREIAEDLSKLDSVALLQMIWAMAKAGAWPKEFPSFFTWIAELENFDLSGDLVGAVAEEAADGFFTQERQEQLQQQQKNLKKKTG